MRMSDWSSDVCSSDLGGRLVLVRVLRIVKAGLCPIRPAAAMPAGPHPGTSQAAWKVRAAARKAMIFWADFSPGASSTPDDRRSVVAGRSGAVGVAFGGQRVIKQKQNTTQDVID